MENAFTINGREYIVIRFLGRGKSGYSYLVSDNMAQYVLKQIHHEPCDYYQFGDKLGSELSAYSRLLALNISMPRLVDADTEQERLLKEYIPGDTVYDMILKDALPDSCISQVKSICSLLYAAGINIDYFPTNFILHGDILYYIDYECNDYMQEWSFENWGIKYWSKTPEFLQHAREHNK